MDESTMKLCEQKPWEYLRKPHTSRQGLGVLKVKDSKCVSNTASTIIEYKTCCCNISGEKSKRFKHYNAALPMHESHVFDDEVCRLRRSSFCGIQRYAHSNSCSIFSGLGTRISYIISCCFFSVRISANSF